ncbi:uncharacterized protein LOC105699099 isoform X2 [Orussus abietinus]|uniref:uncharacterized protein LOC105699099 isoform X2 n=1 Tax=Orussus abietinus TaxID=222816 RepID=UPI000626B7EE|nr:uncharacterized protein LOC105699099 isoform X2 [Orussus abietinus]
MWPPHQHRYMGGVPPHLHPAETDARAQDEALQQQLQMQQQQQHPHHRPAMDLPMPSNPRASRNMAEKQRRDNLNTNISTMATLVPTVAGSSRRMDKISILRLAAAYLRTQYTLGSGSAGFLPRQFSDFDLEQYFVENLVGNGGFLMVVTTTGKIVYISRQVEQHLGHAQNELLGQSLYNFVYSEDHEELTQNLTPEEMQRPARPSGVGDDNSNSSAEDPSSPGVEKSFKEQRRSFNVRMSQRTVSRREHAQYECLHVSGILRLAEACRTAEANGNRTRHRDATSTSNDIVFVGIARLLKKRTITELSLLEANKDEYVTRHLVDGRIIFCDHRISVVAGYMSEEVSGLSAFRFMHKEDVRWTMIGLRQMYDRGEGFGSSCYRLLSKTGEFIYLRTHGYLEFDKNTQTVESFVCINTLVSEEEGIELVKEMKGRFSATITGTSKAMIVADDLSLTFGTESPRMSSKASVEDPSQLEDAITHLISDLPSPSVSEDRLSPSPLPNAQYVKAAIFSQRLPPASIQASKIGIKNIIHPRIAPADKGKHQSFKQEPDESSSGLEGSPHNGQWTGHRREESLRQESGKGNVAGKGTSGRSLPSPERRTFSGRISMPEKRISQLEGSEVSDYRTKLYVDVADKKMPMSSSQGLLLTDEEASLPPGCMDEMDIEDVKLPRPSVGYSSRGKDLTKMESELRDDMGMGRPSVVRETRPTDGPLRIARVDSPSISGHRGKPETAMTTVHSPSMTRGRSHGKLESMLASEGTLGMTSADSPAMTSGGHLGNPETMLSNEGTVMAANVRSPSGSRDRCRGKLESMLSAESTLRIGRSTSMTTTSHRGKPDSVMSLAGGFSGDLSGNESAQTLKRSRSIEDGDDAFSNKRRSNPATSTCGESSFRADPGTECQGSYYESTSNIPGYAQEEISGIICDFGSSEQVEDRILDPEESPGLRESIHPEYQQMDSGNLEIVTSDEDRLTDLQDLQGDILLSPELDTNPELMKIFDDLRPVMGFEKDIDETKVQQFAANDQAVSEGIRRTHIQLANSMALRESQFSVLERDLENPALQAQRENFTQLQAEHKKQKQILKTLQQDHHNMQVNVKHDIGV